jgi:hypothetical protein
MPRGKETVTGKVRAQISYEKVEVVKSHLKPASLNLSVKETLARFSQVSKKDTNRIYAMKVLHK